jgi:hypothetical protein
MSSDDNSRGSKGGVMSSLRKLMGGGKADKASGPDGSGPGEDELILDGGVIPEMPPRRVSGIEDDDGDDALVLGPMMREVAPDSVADDEPNSDQASENPGGDLRQRAAVRVSRSITTR